MFDPKIHHNIGKLADVVESVYGREGRNVYKDLESGLDMMMKSSPEQFSSENLVKVIHLKYPEIADTSQFILNYAEKHLLAAGDLMPVHEKLADKCLEQVKYLKMFFERRAADYKAKPSILVE